MFTFIKKNINKIYNQFTKKTEYIFAKNKPDKEFLKDLENLFVCADAGITTTKSIIQNLNTQIKNHKIQSILQAKDELKKDLIKRLKEYDHIKKEKPKILLLIGVNGSGKTSFAAKFAHILKNENKKILFIAADTFRAAATDQLKEWAKKIGIEIFIGKENQNPTTVIFDGCKKFKEEKFDHLIIDTAGRVQTKINLMKELEKIRRVLGKTLPEEKIETWLTIDAMLGQNSLQQAKIFHNSTKLNGIILTKLDGTGKGAIVFSITQVLQLPITYITFGEKLSDIKEFNSKEYVNGLFEKQ